MVVQLVVVWAAPLVAQRVDLSDALLADGRVGL